MSFGLGLVIAVVVLCAILCWSAVALGDRMDAVKPPPPQEPLPWECHICGAENSASNASCQCGRPRA
jgi:hypothetical protein